MRLVSKGEETDFYRFNDLWEYVITQVGWTEVLSGDEAKGEHLFATFLRSKRRETDTCEQGSDISDVFPSNGSFFTPDTVRHFLQRLWRTLSLLDPPFSYARQKYQRKLIIYLRYFQSYLRKSTFHLRNRSSPVFLFAIHSLYVRTAAYTCGTLIVYAILIRIRIKILPKIT